MRGEWCDGEGNKQTFIKIPAEDTVILLSFDAHPKPNEFRKIRTRCAKCGRLLTMATRYYHDGDYLIAAVPHHKVKSFQKRFVNDKKVKNDKSGRNRQYRNS